MTQSPSAATTRPPTTSRLMFWVALLYFSEGLPLGLFYDLFPVHLRQAGVGPAEIGLLSLLGLAWTVKFLWAPLVDALRGHRFWIAAANLGMAAVLSVGHGLAPGHHQLCRSCRMPLGEAELQSPHYVRGVSCPYCHGTRTPEQERALAERQRQMDLADQRGQAHIGARQPGNRARFSSSDDKNDREDDSA